MKRSAALLGVVSLLIGGLVLGSEGVRDQARPMLTLLRAWQTTGERKYLTSARKYFSLKFMTDHLLDWRRGAYVSRIYQNWHVICPTLDSMYAQNVYEYYRLTGDIDAALQAVGGAHGDRPHHAVAELLLHLEGQAGGFDRERFVDLGHLTAWELHVDHGTDDFHHVTGTHILFPLLALRRLDASQIRKAPKMLPIPLSPEKHGENEADLLGARAIPLPRR